MRISFDPFTLDLVQRRLLRDGLDVHVPPKAFDVLALLVAQRPRAVSKHEIFATAWPGVFVGDATLTTTIRDLRRALDDVAEEPRFIRTVYGFGYAFVADVGASLQPAGPDAASGWQLVHEGRTIHLREGANVVGRTGADVVIEAPSVSRRHARLVVHGTRVSCEDLGSKNGTWVGPTRVEAPAHVEDGAELRFGAVVVLLRRRIPAATTVTLTSPDG
ncbi:MAG: winged helix-turn-helix domain-containing protein [Vicinamibacterales bacterium]